MSKHFPFVGALIFLLLGALAAGAGCDPELILQSEGIRLVVGQRATVRVKDGGDGSSLKAESLRLTDAKMNVFSANEASTDYQVTVSALSSDEVQFVVPPGVAPGEAMLEVFTEKGLSFKSTLTLDRLVAMREATGKVWLLSISPTSGLTELVTITNLGKNAGRVALGPKGSQLAGAIRSAKRVKLAWVSSAPVATKNSADFQDYVEDVAVATTGQTLAATAKGTHVIAKLALDTDSFNVGLPLATGNTVAVVAARKADRAAALGLLSSAATTWTVSLLDLGAAPSIRHKIALSDWSVLTAYPPAIAISADGNTIMVINRNNNNASALAVIRQGATKPEYKPFSGGQKGPRDLAASDRAGKTLFYTVNYDSVETPKPNVSIITVTADTVSFGKPIVVGFSSGAGTPLAIAASEFGEVVALAEKEMALIDPQTRTSAVASFPTLFKGGEVADSLTIQP